MKFCSQCGQGNTDDATFCIQCGSSLEPEGAPTTAAAPPAGVIPPTPPAGAGPPAPGVAPPGVVPPGVVPPGVVPPPQGVTGRPIGTAPGAPYGGVPARPIRQQQPTDGMAVASLVLSIFSFVSFFFCLPVVPAVLGLIFGYMSLTKIEESRGAVGGSELARAGIIIGWINIGLTVLVGIFILVMVLVASTQ